MISRLFRTDSKSQASHESLKQGRNALWFVYLIFTFTMTLTLIPHARLSLFPNPVAITIKIIIITFKIMQITTQPSSHSNSTKKTSNFTIRITTNNTIRNTANIIIFISSCIGIVRVFDSVFVVFYKIIVDLASHVSQNCISFQLLFQISVKQC